MITRTYPPRIGGTGSVVQRVSYALVDNGFDVSVVCSRLKGAPKSERDRGVEIYRTMNVSDSHEFTFLNLGVSVSSMVKKIVECKGHDVFHAHDISVAGFSGCVAKKLINKPFFLKYGGDLVLEYLSLKKFAGWNPKNGLKGTLEYRKGFACVLHDIQNWYFRNYDLVLPNSYSGLEFLKGRGVSSRKLKVILNGVDVDIFHPVCESEKVELKKSCGFARERIIFVASRLVDWKGIDVLIGAVANVFPLIDAKLLIAGSGPEKESLVSLVKKYGLSKRVIFLGDLSREDMPKYLSICDVFVLPSYFEAAPNVLLEAMASGCSCVVSDIDGIREVVSDGCALLTRMGDSEDLASKLIDVLRDSSTSKGLSKRARRRIIERYSWKKVIPDYVKLYDSYTDY